MTTILHLDASARQTGSHSRRLSARFVRRWHEARPEDPVVYRDVGRQPPAPVTAAWIEAAFTRPEQRTPAMEAVLGESDRLVDELIAADLIVAGVPMYNFGVPAPFKAYIDNVVRVGRTFGFDRSRAGEPYWPLLADMEKTLVILSSRGDHGYDRPERIAHMNHVEPSIRTAFGYIGITDVHSIAAEYDEYRDARLARSLADAERRIDALVDRLTGAQDAEPGAPAMLRACA
jgi:FMN-dependent NADH-azoreductase